MKLLNAEGKQLRRRIGFLGGFVEAGKEKPRVDAVGYATVYPDDVWGAEAVKSLSAEGMRVQACQSRCSNVSDRLRW